MRRLIRPVVVAVLTVLLVSIAVFVARRHSRGNKPALVNAPHLEVVPIEKSSRILTEQEVRVVLAEQFRLVYKVEQIPDAVRESFTNFVDWHVEEELSVPSKKKE